MVTPGQAHGVTYLQSLFPSLDVETLRDVLQQSNGSVDNAANALFDMAPGVKPMIMFDQEARRGASTHRPSTKAPLGKGWSSLTAEARHAERPLSQYSRQAHAAAPASDTTAFPALTSGRQPPQHVKQTGVEMNGVASRESLGAATSRQGEFAGQRQWPRNDDKDRVSASGHAEGPVGPLSEIHPWADEALLKDVLAAAGGDLASAAWILTELQAPTTNTNTPSASPLVTPNASPLVSPSASPQRRLGSHQASPPSAQARNHSRPPGLKSPRDVNPTQGGPVAGVVGPKSVSREVSSDRAKNQPEKGVSSPSVPAYPEDDKQDAYYSFRTGALQLTRRWQKAAQKAGSSFSGNDHSAARKHAREARILRNSALAAHAAAAEAIEHANNEGRGLDMWTLDLHGLHVAEAIAAVDRRLRRLEEHLLAANVRAAELNVITGRGNHSSGGEGSLGRAIVNHLLGRGTPHNVRGGVVVVQARMKRKGGP